MTISNGTPFVFYLPRRGAGGGVTTVGRFTGGNAGNFVITASTCGSSIAAGGNCTVTIAATGISGAGSYSTTFQPNGTFQQTGDGASSTWAGVPNWLVNMGTAVADVYVSNASAVNVTATSTIAALASGAPNLGTVWYGATPPTAAVTFRNDGNVPMTLTGLSGLSSMFSVTANSCTNVAAGGQCSMTVRMATGAAGAGPSTVTTVGATTNATFNVSGAVHSAVGRWSATSLSFGNVTINGSSTQNITLYNDGFGAAVNWAGALSNLPAGFSANTSACSGISPGGSCNVAITFSPTAFQAYGGGSVAPSGIVSYNNNTLSLSGTGTGTKATLIAGDLAFGSVALASSSPTRNLTWRNDGNITADLMSAFTGLSLPFVVTYNGCANIAPSGTCTVSVRLNTDTNGSWSQTGSTVGATINASVPASGSVSGSIATMIPANPWISFGTVGYGTTPPQATWTFRNDGNQAMTLALSALTSPFSLVSNTCSSIGSGASCTIRTQMATGTAGSFSKNAIAVTGANVGSRSDLSLAGTVNAPVISKFTVTYVSDNGVQATWTVRNNGTAPATLTALGVTDPRASIASSSCSIGSSVAVGATCTVITNDGSTCSGNSPYYLTATNSAGTAQANQPSYIWDLGCGS
jgi:hypothetical protein